MAKAQQQNRLGRGGMSGLERLELRVSSMINHPVAQIQRWVTIHGLDTDGQREWEEVMGLLSETGCIEMAFNDDESVTLRWEVIDNKDRPGEMVEAELESAPF
ncbi:DUF1654 domain-containing protein [Pseudomonas atacamensis]|uniref:DUF1654 domain-containing protein n=1 Tax=Pseudomonas atacamensis TaxID=2565368 RepID=UPI00215FF662|nr:DUF1654 domain-containing protein [Pseudomonas atacamensis]UVK96080.1 DUF1654 domain-containing protein [Pseudomonas atacamensis]